jgi:methionyl-tRNA synthetase
MADKKPFYITTTIPYVNADPHVGFALEILQADVLARYNRLFGREVFFSTGSDEFGQKIWEAAEKEGVSAQEYTDKFAERFDGLKSALNLSYDNFIRTTSDAHIKAAQDFWKACEANGDIYKKSYKGLYCVGCEMFVKEKDLVDGKCPHHPNQELQEIEEENYFFKLSAYQDQLVSYLENENSITPDWRRKEALNFVQNGLEDFSISRSKERLSWGVPVPGDDTQVMYVWFGAFVNYISTLGWPGEKFDNFWTNGEVLQVAGKDQIRFQSIMWQAMLFSAGVKNTDSVLYHGFINSGGQKMSKSIGNVLNPYDLVEEYGTDAVRYYLLRHIHPFDDSDMTPEKFKEAYNAHLANGVGNLMSRVLNMVERYKIEYDQVSQEQALDEDSATGVAWKDIRSAMANYRFDEALNLMWKGFQMLDEAITSKQPFKKIKENPDEAKEDIKEVVHWLWMLAWWLAPILPDTSEKMIEMLVSGKKPESPLFMRKD